jgi:hypothetical protein
MEVNEAINGPQRAKVVDVDDPKGMLRATVRIVGIWDSIADANLPWAERVLGEDGTYRPLLAGDYVWIDFPYNGDSTRPRIVGGASDSPGGVPNLPAEVSGQGSAYTQKSIDGAPTAGTVTASKDFVYDRNGLLEIRNASGSWSVTHKSSGTTLGMNDGGQLYLNSQLTLFVYSEGDATVKTAGNMAVEAAGDMSLKAGGTLSLTAQAITAQKG